MKTILYWEGMPIEVPNPLNIIPQKDTAIIVDNYEYEVRRVEVNFDISTIIIYPHRVRG